MERLSLSSLTPSQREIEQVIDKVTIEQEEAEELLRCLSNMNEEAKSILRYHTSSYLVYLIECNDEIINKLKARIPSTNP